MLIDELRAHRQRTLIVLLVAALIVFALWNIPQLSPVLYPFRLFVTLVHEAGHGLAALLSGGRFISFEVYGNGAGQALTAGGSRALILPAGYLGTALFGAVVFYLVNRLPYPRALAYSLGVLIILLSVLFGLSSTTALLVGGTFGLLLMLMGWKANRTINLLVLNVLAILTGLNAVLDIYWLVGNSGAGLGDLRNDAAAFSAEVMPLVPPAIWALIWAILAALMLGLSLWYAVIRPLRAAVWSA